jgi:hypothetical protein
MDNPQAFPRPHSADDIDADLSYPAHAGMTLRDYFAGQALASVNLGIGVTDEFHRRTANHCYALADAMLKAREV